MPYTNYDNEKKELFSYDNPASIDRQNERSLTTLEHNRYTTCRLSLANPLAQMAPNMGGDDYTGLIRSDNITTHPGTKSIKSRVWELKDLGTSRKLLPFLATMRWRSRNPFMSYLSVEFRYAKDTKIWPLFQHRVSAAGALRSREPG